jgi:heme A synthase
MAISVGGILLGVINIAIVVVLLLLVGVIGWWIITSLLGLSLPGEVRQLYIALVALIALYMIVALIFGLPSITVIRGGP